MEPKASFEQISSEEDSSPEQVEYFDFEPHTKELSEEASSRKAPVTGSASDKVGAYDVRPVVTTISTKEDIVLPNTDTSTKTIDKVILPDKEHLPETATVTSIGVMRSSSAKAAKDDKKERRTAASRTETASEIATTKPCLSATDLDDAKGYARTLRQVCNSEQQQQQQQQQEQRHVDVESVQVLLDLCRGFQDKVKTEIEQATATTEEQPQRMLELIQLLENLNLAVEQGKETCNKLLGIDNIEIDSDDDDDYYNKKPAAAKAVAAVAGSSSSSSSSSSRRRRHSFDVQDLIDKEDVFSLICMLRAPQDKQLLDAAMALMKFARGAEQQQQQQQQEQQEETMRLRRKILSNGGVHPLLQVFGACNGRNGELKIVSALAIAYILPGMVVEDTAATTATTPATGIKIMECLNVLSVADSVFPNGETVTEQESFKASATGLTAFWINHLYPMLNDSEQQQQEAGKKMAPAAAAAAGEFQTTEGISQATTTFGHETRSIERQELLEMTVSLFIFIARNSFEKVGEEQVKVNWGYRLVLEQMCIMEGTRMIAVQEGILSLLVSWIKSGDLALMEPAVSALRHLTSIKDKYGSGWIHSQIVNEGAVQAIASLSHYDSVSPEVDLAIAQILCCLCEAPRTRTAVVECQGVEMLIGYLAKHKLDSYLECVLLASRALLAMASDAITKANVFRDEDFAPAMHLDRRDDVVERMIGNGVLDLFVEIADDSRTAKQRAVAIKALRVLSEDMNSSHLTRILLCERGAAKTLGNALKDNVDRIEEVLNRGSDHTLFPQESLEELQDALCALASILEPVPEDSQVVPQHRKRGAENIDARECLINGCLQLAENGGLESLLFLASLPLVSSKELVVSHGQWMSLLEEACRLLASISPLLLTEAVAKKGYSRWTDGVLKVLHRVLKQIEDLDDSDTIGGSAMNVRVNVLRGVAALARSEPLKVRIIDKVLRDLLRVDTVLGGTDTSDAVTGVFKSLGFSENEVVAEIAGNSPELLAYWFCLEQSLLIQAMAQEEVKRVVQDSWAPHLRENSATATSSQISVLGLFENFVSSNDTEEEIESMLRQYKEVYGRRESPAVPASLVNETEGDGPSHKGLLTGQIFPLNSADTETKWVLAHQRFVRKAERTSEKKRTRTLSKHVESLLGCCFPSRLLRNCVLPINNLIPSASFDFRALMMPRKQYFSFRREGQLLARVCESGATARGTKDVHWTLGFRDSLFTGDFSDSLIDVLHQCPMIVGLSFSWTSGLKLIAGDGDRGRRSDQDGTLLANLAGSVPQSIGSLTFDGILKDQDMKILVQILKQTGTPPPVSGIETVRETTASVLRRRTEDPDSSTSPGSSDLRQRPARFWFFAVRRSTAILPQTWMSFFNLIGEPGPSRHMGAPLSCLKALDLSGNQLGDEMCALILRIVHDRDSQCCLEQLDLSGNRIAAGSNVLGVLREYAGTRKTSKKGHFKSPLHTLHIANNGLHSGNVCLEIITLLKDNLLELQVLDLSSNGLGEGEIELFSVLASSLSRNTCLRQLNLSKNRFSYGAINHLLELLSAGNDSALSFLLLDDNSPPLSSQQEASLSSFCYTSRKKLLQNVIRDREKRKREEETGVEHIVPLGVRERPKQAKESIEENPAVSTSTKSERKIAVAERRSFSEKEHSQSRRIDRTIADFSPIGQSDSAMTSGSDMPLKRKNELDHAVVLHKRAVDVMESLSKKRLIQTSLSSASAESVLGRGDVHQALGYCETALSIRESTLDQNHVDTASSNQLMAEIFFKLGEYDQALEYCESALSVRESILDQNHVDTACSNQLMAEIFFKLGEYDQALDYCEAALSVRESILDQDHVDTASSNQLMAEIFFKLREYDQALEYCETVLSVRESTLDQNHADTACSNQLMAEIFFKLGEYGTALEYCETALSVRETILDQNHVDMACSNQLMAEIFFKLGEYDQALEYCESALSVRESVPDQNHVDTACSNQLMAEIFFKLGEYDQALEYCEAALSVRESTLDQNHVDTASSNQLMAEIFFKLGEFDTALDYCKSTLNIRKSMLDQSRADTASSNQLLAEIFLKCRERVLRGF